MRAAALRGCSRHARAPILSRASRLVAAQPRLPLAAPLLPGCRGLSGTLLRAVTAQPRLQSPLVCDCRALSGGSPSATTPESLSDSFSDEYAEARELLSDAEEGRDTVYFEEDLQDATEAVEALLARYAAEKERLPQAEAAQLHQMVGLKMEELRSRLQVTRRRARARAFPCARRLRRRTPIPRLRLPPPHSGRCSWTR